VLGCVSGTIVSARLLRSYVMVVTAAYVQLCKRVAHPCHKCVPLCLSVLQRTVRCGPAMTRPARPYRSKKHAASVWTTCNAAGPPYFAPCLISVRGCWIDHGGSGIHACMRMAIAQTNLAATLAAKGSTLLPLQAIKSEAHMHMHMHRARARPGSASAQQLSGCHACIHCLLTPVHDDNNAALRLDTHAAVSTCLQVTATSVQSILCIIADSVEQYTVPRGHTNSTR
jgi:hypothetical protein